MEKTKYNQEIQALIDSCLTEISILSPRVKGTLRQIIQRGKDLQDDALLGFAYYYQAQCLYYQGGSSASYRSCLKKAFFHALRADDQAMLSHIYGFIAADALNNGCFDIAYNNYIMALSIANRRGDAKTRSLVEANIGRLYGELRDYKAARKYVRKSIAQHRKQKNAFRYLQNMVIMLASDALISLNLKDLPAAEKSIREMESFFERGSGEVQAELQLSRLYLLTRLALEKGEEEESTRLFEEFLPVLRQQPQVQDMLEDIRLLKKFNFNAVRTCHYPDSHIWYDLCDEYGIWVLDETDVECHACYPLLCRDPRWKNLFVTRGERMVLRDRSHACIFGWSVGNESGNGENHEAQIRAMRALDGSRIIHHEGEIKPGWRQGGMVFGEGRKEFNELFDPMYIAPDLLKQYGENAPERPAILCEYAHAMGNSSGSLCDYWKLFYSLPGLQGGFIWDWIDQGLLERRDGKDMLCYGGDFGEEVHDFDFCCNGMIAADRRLHPAMYEFRHLVQPVKVTLTDGGKMTFILKSMRDFVSLADLRGVWSFEIDGAETQRGELPDLSGVGPQDTLKFALPLEKKGTGRRGFVNFRFTLKADAPWAEKGTLLAHDQIEVTAFLDLAPKAVPVVGTSPVLAEKAGTFSLRSGDTRIVVDPSGRGVLKRRGRTLLDTLFEANLFRAGTDNDGIRNQLTRMDKPLGQWLAAGLDALETVSVRVTARGGGEPSVFICRTLRGTDPRALCVFRQRITALRDGSFVFAQSFRLPAKFPSMPRIGVIASAAPGFERVRYFGRGPWENYSDRCASAQYGLYETTVKGMYEDSYILPQENGCRTGVTLLELSSHDQCLRLFADTPFSFGVSHFTAQDLMAARHQCELVPRRETFLAVDLARRGLGTGSCGPQTLPQYRLDEKRYAFTFRLQVL